MDKRKALFALYVMAVLITVCGVGLSIYSYINDVKFQVLNTGVPGYIFGLVAIFLGVRYFRSTAKLKKELNSTDMKFNWNNFKRERNGLNHKRGLRKV